MFDYCDKLIEELDGELKQSKTKFHNTNTLDLHIDKYITLDCSSSNASKHGEKKITIKDKNVEVMENNLAKSNAEDTKRMKITKNFKKQKKMEVGEAIYDLQDIESIRTKLANRSNKASLNSTKYLVSSTNNEMRVSSDSKPKFQKSSMQINNQSLYDILAGCKTEIKSLRKKNSLLEEENSLLNDRVQ